MGKNSAILPRWFSILLLSILVFVLIDSHPLWAGDDDEGDEWKTMHSERGYRRHSSHRASKSSAGSSSIKWDEQKQKITTPKISFGSNGIDPTSQSQSVIKQLANFLEKKPELVIRVEGHSDSVGSDQSNLDISQKRADRVKELLVAAGVGAERVEAVGMGDKYPIASDTTPSGQEKNRRVEFAVMGSIAPATVPTEPVAPVAPVMPMPVPAPVAPVYPPAAPTVPPATPVMPMPTAPSPVPAYPTAPSYPTAPAYPSPTMPTMPPTSSAPPAPMAPSYPTAPAYPSAQLPYPTPQPVPSPAPVAPSYPSTTLPPAASPAPSTTPPVPTPVR